jgi:hypothetical protein
MLDVVWDPDQLQTSLESLLPAVDRSLDQSTSLSGLSAAVRADVFTTRFRHAVLEPPSPDHQRWPQVA